MAKNNYKKKARRKARKSRMENKSASQIGFDFDDADISMDAKCSATFEHMKVHGINGKSKVARRVRRWAEANSDEFDFWLNLGPGADSAESLRKERKAEGETRHTPSGLEFQAAMFQLANEGGYEWPATRLWEILASKAGELDVEPQVLGETVLADLMEIFCKFDINPNAFLDSVIEKVAGFAERSDAPC